MKDLKNKVLIQLPPLTQKTSYVILGVLLVVVLLFDYAFLMRFQLKALSSLGVKISKYNNDLKDTKYHIERIGLYEAEAVRSRDRFAKVKMSVLTREEIPMILESVSRIASSAGVQIDQIMPMRDPQQEVLKTDAGHFSALPILVKAQGAYHGIGRFFNQLETNDVFANIESFDIFQNSVNPQRHILQAMIIVFLKEESSP